MAVHASITFKHLPASDDTSVFDCWFLLGVHPGTEIVRPVHRNAEEHFGVLRSAILCALTHENSGALRVHPHPVGMVWNEVRLACKLRHPEAVVGVDREQLQERWRRMIRIAHRNVQFVGGDDPQFGIAKFPPELMSNRDHIDVYKRQDHE